MSDLDAIVNGTISSSPKIRRVAGDALDEIDRLNARVDELEAALRECDKWVQDQVKYLEALARPELEAALRQLDTEWVNGNVSTLAYERITGRVARPEPKT